MQQLSNQELAELLQTTNGVILFNEYRDTYPHQEIDFSGYDFSGLDLQKAGFGSKMRLDGTNFSNADLTHAYLSGAKGRHTIFKDTTLEMACLSEAELIDAVFDGADCAEASFRDSRLDGSSFKGAACLSATFDAARLVFTNFEEADLSEACLVDTDLQNTMFDGAEIETTNFARAKNVSHKLRCLIIRNLLQGWEE